MRPAADISQDARSLYSMWASGHLGGQKMPEDVHPDLRANAAELVHYLTLGMCLNYQRNSYVLWESCTATYADPETRWVFDPAIVMQRDQHVLQRALLRYKTALQPNKHPENWRRVCAGIVKFGNGDMRNILTQNNYDISEIRHFIQTNKTSFPYLAGPKICNYWLFVLLQYTALPLKNRQSLTIAPDRHILKASQKLGLLTHDNANSQTDCSTAWQRVLTGSELLPIDMHTPLWLWSRSGFPDIKSPDGA